MKRTGLLYDERFLNHLTGSYHPESPARLTAIFDGLKEAGILPKLKLVSAIPAELKWIEAIHDKAYIDRFKEQCLSGADTFDYPDNQMCPKTYDTALLAVGGIIEIIRQVMSGEIDNAFCAVRPPGHHAECNLAMGFCYFANVAIATNYLLSQWNIERVGIIDFDVHHGNGTQHLTEEDPRIFYYSIHEHPSFSFPGTGRIFEKGVGNGKGFCRNFPVLPGQGDEEYQKLIENDLIPVFDQYKPQFLLISAGFDAHMDDVMSGVKLSTAGYSWMMEKIMDLAEKYADGKIVSVLEGGYSLARLPELVLNHIQILLSR